MVLETLMKFFMTAVLTRKNLLCLKNWENRPKMGQKQGFVNLLKNLVIFFTKCFL